MSELTLIIGNKNYSSWSLRPWIFMKQNNVSFTENRIFLFTNETKSKLEKYGSDCKVPVLIDNDLVIWDSLSILEYISENYLNSKGWPSDAKARAVARSVSLEMHSSFSNIRNLMPMNCRKKFHGFKLEPQVEKEIERIKELWRRCRNEFGGEGEWLFGEYSIADAMFAPIALRFEGYCISTNGIESDYIQSILNQPHIKAWIEAGKLENEIIQINEISE